jgi:carbonyl reductase 1
MSDARIALVTGANQGLGLALSAGLAARMNPDDLVLLTGRHAQRVADAPPRSPHVPRPAAGCWAGFSTSPIPVP